MPFVEGKGWIIGAPREILIVGSEMIATCGHAINVSNAKGYNLENCIVGLSGEAAVGKFIEVELGIFRTVNWNSYHGGDGGVDLTIYKKTFQVKTTYWGDVFKVPRFSYGKDRPLVADYFVFCRVLKYIRNTFAQVAIAGWLGRNDLEEYGRFTTKDKKSFLEIEPFYLQNCNDFLLEIQNIKAAQ